MSRKQLNMQRKRQSKNRLLSREVSADEKGKLEARSQEIGLKSGFYNAWEIYEWGEVQIQENLKSAWADDFKLSLIYYMTLKNLIARIAGYVSLTRPDAKLWVETPDKSFVYPFNEVDAGNLSKLYTQLMIVLERTGTPPPADILETPRLIDGIRNLINGRDGGISLRAAVSVARPLDMTQWVNALLKPGAPKQSVIDRLCARAKPYHDADSGSWPEIFDRILNDLARIEKRTPEQTEEFQKLEKWGSENLNDAFKRRYPVPSLTGRT